MRLQLTQLRGLLGPDAEELWLGPAMKQRQVQCASVVYDAAEIRSALYGELVVLATPVEDIGLEDVLAFLAERRAAGLMVRTESLSTLTRSALRAAPERLDIATGVLANGTAAETVANHVNRALARAEITAPGVYLLAANSVQAVADTLGRLVGNSVTIESPRHELLAFSAMEGPVDRVREETILRRAGYAPALAWVLSEGHVARVLASETPVHVPPNSRLGFAGRLACRIAYEGEVLGIVWVTNTARPLTERDEGVVVEASHAAAAVLMRQREATQRQEELRTEVLEDIVRGRVTNRETIRAVARSIGWNIDHLRQALIVAFDNIETFRLRHTSGNGRSLQRARERLTELIRLEILAIDPEAVIGPRSSGAIVLFSVPSADEDAGKSVTLRLAGRIVQRFHEANAELTVTVGIGTITSSFERIEESVRLAEMAAHLGARLWGGNRAVHFSDLGIHRALFALQGHDEMITPALQRIIDYDAAHDAALLETLDAYLAGMGRLRYAAEALGVHRNTLEYRVHRIEEIAGIRLDDRDTRLSLELGMRLLELRKSTGG